MWKHTDDLLRYAEIIRATQPRVVIETGTHTGDSARWFANWPSVELVITIDITGVSWKTGVDNGKIHRLIADSVAPSTVATVGNLVERHALRDVYGAPSRVLVSLDSDHSRDHVRREIEAYGPMAGNGGHLVVEDGVLAWLSTRTQVEHNIHGRYRGTVLEAIEESASMLDRMGFTRDLDIETMTPVTMHPAGWWRG